jgi:hypothetical protein
MHGPSALPLLVELAATAIVVAAALAPRPLARALHIAARRAHGRRRLSRRAAASS